MISTEEEEAITSLAEELLEFPGRTLRYHLCYINKLNESHISAST